MRGQGPTAPQCTARLAGRACFDCHCSTLPSSLAHALRIPGRDQHARVPARTHGVLRPAALQVKALELAQAARRTEEARLAERARQQADRHRGPPHAAAGEAPAPAPAAAASAAAAAAAAPQDAGSGSGAGRAEPAAPTAPAAAAAREHGDASRPPATDGSSAEGVHGPASDGMPELGPASSLVAHAGVSCVSCVTLGGAAAAAGCPACLSFIALANASSRDRVVGGKGRRGRQGNACSPTMNLQPNP